MLRWTTTLPHSHHVGPGICPVFAQRNMAGVPDSQEHFGEVVVPLSPLYKPFPFDILRVGRLPRG